MFVRDTISVLLMIDRHKLSIAVEAIALSLPLALLFSPHFVGQLIIVALFIVAALRTKSSWLPVLLFGFSLIAVGVGLTIPLSIYAIRLNGFVVVALVVVLFLVLTVWLPPVTVGNSIPRPSALVLGAVWSVMFLRLPWDVAGGMQQITTRGGDGASFLLNFAASLGDGEGYIWSSDANRNGGSVLGTFIVFVQSFVRLFDGSTLSAAAQPMLMWRLYWMSAYVLIVASVILLAALRILQGRVASIIALGIISLLTGVSVLSLSGPGLLSAVVVATVFAVALSLGGYYALAEQPRVLILSLMALVGMAQTWLAFGAVTACVLAVWMLSTPLHQARTYVRGLWLVKTHWLVKAALLAMIPATAVIIFLALRTFIDTIRSLDTTQRLLGLGGGDAKYDLLLVALLLAFACAGFTWNWGTAPGRWLSSIVVGAFGSALIVAVAAYSAEPYWLEYGPKKYMIIVAVVFLPLSIAGIASLVRSDSSASRLLTGSLVVLLFFVAMTEPMAQSKQLFAPPAPRPWQSGLEVALDKYPGKRVVCIDTQYDGNGYEAYDCSEFGLGLTNHSGPERLFMSGNLCWASPSAYAQFDEAFYRDTVILVSDRNRLSTTTGCQERSWESDGRPDDPRWFIGWPTLVKWQHATVLDYSGAPVTPSYSYLRGHPDYPDELIDMLEESLK